MAHGTADWGVSAASVTTFQLTDLGELAARLWSIDYFDRRGEAIFMEDFECAGARYSTFVAGTGASAGVITNEARSGQNAMQLICGSDGLAIAAVQKYIGQPKRGYLGIEASIRFVSGAPIAEVRIEYHDAATVTRFAMTYDISGRVLSYLGSDGLMHIFASNLTLPGIPTLFHTFKLVGDVVSGKYVRAIVNGIAYDLSAFAANVAAGPAGNYALVQVSSLSPGGSNETIYVDDIIVTQNEPV